MDFVWFEIFMACRIFTIEIWGWYASNLTKEKLAILFFPPKTRIQFYFMNFVNSRITSMEMKMEISTLFIYPCSIAVDRPAYSKFGWKLSISHFKLRNHKKQFHCKYKCFNSIFFLILSEMNATRCTSVLYIKIKWRKPNRLYQLYGKRPYVSEC